AGVGALENQSAQTLPQCQLAGDAAAERFTQRDNVGRRKTFLSQPLMRRLSVEVGALFIGPPLAPTIAAIIEDEDSDAGFEQRGAMFEPMTDVARVAVAEQVNELFARGVRVSGIIPAVQSNTIGRLEVNVLERAAQFAPVRLHLAVRLI